VIRIGDRAEHTRTDGKGHFEVEMEANPGPQRIELSFPGTNQLDPSSFVTTTDPSRATVKLAIGAEDTADGAKLIVRATDENEASMKLPVQLLVGPPGDDKLLVPVARVETGTPYALKRGAVGGAGQKHVRATFAGDTSTQAATADATVELSTGTSTSMSVDKTNLAFEDDLRQLLLAASPTGRFAVRTGEISLVFYRRP
jgi:hypothetical protein